MPTSRPRDGRITSVTPFWPWASNFSVFFRVQSHAGIYLEEIVNELRSSRPQLAFLAQAIVVSVAILSAASSFAQNGSLSPYQGEQDGVSAGGKWLKFQSEDKMTGAKRVRFQLLAENYFREDPQYKPRVDLICENNKLKMAAFNPGIRVRPNRPGFWGQPQIEVEVRIDDFHTFHGWNWGDRGLFLSMDKGTARGMMGSHVFNVALRTRSGRQIAEFDPEGLNLDEVRKSCDLTPKKPSKD